MPDSSNAAAGKQTVSNEETPLLGGANAAAGPAFAPAGSEGLVPEPQVSYSGKALTSGSDEYGTTRDSQREDETGSREEENVSPYLSGVSITRFWLIFSCVLIQLFLASFDSTLMASSHPVITSYFNASNSASWLSTAFLLTSTALSPLFGRVSDTIGRRTPHLFSMVVLMLATSWCGLSPSIGSLIAARAVAGFGAGGINAMGSILTNDLVPIEIRGTYQAYINIFYGLGSVCGVSFGGTLCEKLGWRWTFGMQVPLMLSVFICAWLTVPYSLGPHLAKNSPKSAFETLKSFDLLGSLFLAISVASLILGLNLGGNILPWTHPFIISSLVLAGITGIILLRVESKAYRPVMPLSVIFTRPRGQLIFSNFFCQVAFSALLFNLPLVLQAVYLKSASSSGFRLTPAFLVSTVLSVAAGFIITATRRMKPLLVVGSISAVIGSICSASMGPELPPWVATAFLVPSAMGQALIMPTTTVAALANSTPADQAVTSTSISMFRSLGTVMGVAISSLILQNALVAYLNQLVTGKHKAEIISMVRKSVHSVIELTGKHQAQVIEAYSKALSMALLTAVVAYVVAAVLLLPAKVGTLARK